VQARALLSFSAFGPCLCDLHVEWWFPTLCCRLPCPVLQVHKRPDFQPWVALDMDMEKSFRDKIFEKAGTRKSPFLFIDDEYVGGYEQVKEMNDRGELQPILNY